MLSLAQNVNRRLLWKFRHRAFSGGGARKPDPFSCYEICRDTVREIHGRFIRTHQHNNPNSMFQVIKSYALSPSPKAIDKARFALLEIENPTLTLWNHMLRGLSRSDRPGDALEVFDRMCERGLSVDNLTCIYVCKACARVSEVWYGKRVHTRVLKLGFGSYLYVCNALIHMYGCCGDLGSSRGVFDEMGEKDLVSWNSLICSYSHCGKYRQVLGLFDLMRAENEKADAVTMVKVVLACEYLGEFELVDSFVEYIDGNCIDMDVYLGNTLIHAYGSRGSLAMARSFFDRITEKNLVSWNTMMIAAAKAEDLDQARRLFDEMPWRDVISWTSLISGYCQGNRPKEAVSLFQEMMAADIRPDQVTLSSVLAACARVGRLDMGKLVHEVLRKSKTKPDIYIENALIGMYCKCGSVEDALELFRSMKEKDSVSWTSVISGLAVNGDSEHALQLFSDMLREGVVPSYGTFVGVLLACVHAGLVEEGLHFFDSMQKDYGLIPEMKHYGCVVDLLCRAGYLLRAHEFIEKMPVSPDPVIWTIFLSACKVHENMVLAQIATEKLVELDAANSLNCVLSSSSYASAQKWEDATKMRELIDKSDTLKPFGWSSVHYNTE